jgi:ABC-type lipoprotein export system ATPase subunit
MMNALAPALGLDAVPVLQLSGICKSFNIGEPNETEILHSINLSLMPGEFCAIIGPSGSGKSTLLNTIGLLDRPSSGSLRIQGTETTSMNDRELTHLRGHQIGFIFQYHHLLSAFSALENVYMPMFGELGFAHKHIYERASDLLASVGLQPWLHAQASHLSGGQQQRIALARMFLKNPPIIFLDEPTASLDAIASEQIKQSLDEIKQGRTVIIISHSLSQIIDADYTYVMKEGCIAEHGEHEALYRQDGVYKEIFDAMAKSLNIEKIAKTFEDDTEEETHS